MIMVKLREQTRAYHDRLEERLDLFSSASTLAGYQEVLQRFYGFYRPLEPLLEERLTFLSMNLDVKINLKIDYAKRRKTGLLESDLRRLGASEKDLNVLPLCPRIPRLATPAQVLGCLYVLEGATLGGQIIARYLQNALELNASNGASFFSSYGSEVGHMWREFGAAVTAYSQTHEEDDSIIAAACETFAALELWLCAEEVVAVVG